MISDEEPFLTGWVTPLVFHDATGLTSDPLENNQQTVTESSECACKSDSKFLQLEILLIFRNGGQKYYTQIW